MNTKVVNERSRFESSVLMEQFNLLLYTILDNSRAHVLKDFIMIVCVHVHICVCTCVSMLSADGEQIWEMSLLV